MKCNNNNNMFPLLVSLLLIHCFINLPQTTLAYKAGTPFQILPCNETNPRQLYTIKNEGTFSQIFIGRGKDPNNNDVVDSAGGTAGGTTGSFPHIWSQDNS